MSSLQPHFDRFLAYFNPLTFPPGFGFDPYTQEDIDQFFNTPTQLEFRFKKSKGANILYSMTHAKARQRLFNHLPFATRMALIQTKFSALGLDTCFPGVSLFDCLDVLDIGMGHSVYVFRFESHSWVFKQEELPNQSLHCRLLTSLGWPSFESQHYKTPQISYELSDYLGTVCLSDYLGTSTLISQDDLLIQLAQHAALGDSLGRGDRHFNNYMVMPQGLVPIDISFLFWEGNEAWDAEYIAGGMAEFSMLSPYTGDLLKIQQSRFFDHYLNTLQFLSLNHALIETQLLTFYGDNHVESADKLAFIQTRLSDVYTYFESQRDLYLAAFDEMRIRQAAKNRLTAAVDKNPDILTQYPLLRMYYMVDHNQPSCFFLWKNHPELPSLLDQVCG